MLAEGEQVTETESDSDTDDTTPLIRPGSYGTQGGTFVPQRVSKKFYYSHKPKSSVVSMILML